MALPADVEPTRTEHAAPRQSTNFPAPVAAPKSKWKLALLTTALCLAVFCQALDVAADSSKDNTIISTAIPTITNEFGSLQDVGWYGSGYLVACCALQLSYGKLYSNFPTKWVFLIALGIFEVGSLICAATPTSIGLILGRVVAGVGSGGIYSGAILVIAASTSIDKLPIYNGILAAMYAVASVAGPLLGGAFTTRITWRLCFYINLPFGLVTAICVVFFLSSTDGEKPNFKLPVKEKMKQLDFIGLAAFIPTIVCLLLALTWGGSTYNWANARIIALFILSGLFFVAFVASQLWQKDRATVPPGVFSQRTVWACSLYVFFLFGSFIALLYYLPLWLQAIQEASAVQSGIDILPTILSTVISALVGGALISWIGYYTWACIVSSMVATVGVGLMTTFGPSTQSATWIGYQILFGAGCGLGLQQPLVAMQAVLSESQAAEGTAIIIFFQNFGGAIFLTAAQNVFNNQLVKNVVNHEVPINPEILFTEGATNLPNLVPTDDIAPLKAAYSLSVTQAFYISVATAGCSLIGSALIPWVSVKVKGQEKAAEGAAQDRDDTGSSIEMT